jgi:hypothetical protein
MKRTTLFILIIIAAVISSCRKTPDFDQLSLQFIVSTNLDKTADFGNYKDILHFRYSSVCGRDRG